MATTRQLQAVENLEAGLRALESEGIPYLERNAKMICDRAGESFYVIRPMIEAVKKTDPALLARFYAVFSQTAKLPRCLEDVNAPLNANDIPERCPPMARDRMPQSAVSGPQDVTTSRNVLDQVLAILDPLPQSARERVISTASTYYGVGT